MKYLHSNEVFLYVVILLVNFKQYPDLFNCFSHFFNIVCIFYLNLNNSHSDSDSVARISNLSLVITFFCYRKKKTSRALVAPQEFTRSISVPADRVVSKTSTVGHNHVSTATTAVIVNNSSVNNRTPMTPTEDM